MMSININRFILTPARVCDLEGLCDQSRGVPCRIKAGPRRWLTCRAIPEELGVTLWQEKEGSVTYRRKEPVQISEDPEGGLV